MNQSTKTKTRPAPINPNTIRRPRYSAGQYITEAPAPTMLLEAKNDIRFECGKCDSRFRQLAVFVSHVEREVVQ